MADAALPLLARPVTALNRDRVGWVVLGGGAAVYFVLSLWLTRGTTFNADELGYFSDDRGFDLENIFTPHNGHLIVVTRIIYAASFNVFGVAYTPFRLAEPASGLAVAVFLFALLKRRIGAAAALAPTLVVLFLGSSPITLFPVGIQILNAVAAGLGGLLALEQRSMRWDLVACALLIVSVLSFSTGVAFVAGAAVWILVGDDRWQRAWVFLAPAGIYAGWWLWAQQFDGLPLTVSNLLLTPNYGAESLASALAALTGLSTTSAPNGRRPQCQRRMGAPPRGGGRGRASARAWYEAVLPDRSSGSSASRQHSGSPAPWRSGRSAARHRSATCIRSPSSFSWSVPKRSGACACLAPF